MTERLYLDHAATSWPKPSEVVDAMADYIRQCGAAAGRGNYRSATQAAGIVRSLRVAIGRWIGAPGDLISFHANGTAALNVAIHGLLRPGDHVVTSSAEHNSVLRPLHRLQRDADIRLSIVDCDRFGRVDADQLLGEVTERTRLVALTHASNVTGAIQPVQQVGNALRSHSAWLLCDAAQTFGVCPIDVAKLGIDLLAAPGHKGGQGPLGTGLLYAAPDCVDQLRPLLQGGTGSDSESLEMPETYPDKLEAGNLNVPALAGWLAGIGDPEDAVSRWEHANRLSSRLHNRVGDIEGLTIFGEPGDLPILSLASGVLAPADLASILDSDYQIETRAGLHCAALIHKTIGSHPDGTLRISAGTSTTESDIDRVADALAEITAGMRDEIGVEN